MKHPESGEILDYYRGEIPEERVLEIEEHLTTCEVCRGELRSLETVGGWLAGWEDEPVEEESIERVRNTLEILGAARVEQTAANGQPHRVFRTWFWRAAGAAAVVAFMLLFQAFIWNPFKSPVNLLAVFNLSTTAFAMPADQALPDTVLVITVHHDGTFSTPVLSGRYELEELTEELSALVPKGEYRSILLTGEDKDDPVSLALEDLGPLKEELDIKEVHVGEGVIGVASVLFENWLTPAPFSRGMPIRGEEGWPAGEPWTIQTFPMGWAFIHQDSLRADRFHNTALRNFWIRSAFMPDPNDVLLKALTEPSSVTATVAESGEYILSRAVVSVEEVEDSLKRMLDLNPDLSLTILVEDEDNPGDAALRLESIARRVGLENVTFKMVKRP